MAPEHLSCYSPHIPCNWEALEQVLISWHPWEGGKLPGVAQPAWIVLAWVPDPYLLMAQLLAPAPSSSYPSLPYPIPSFSSPLLLVSMQHGCTTISIFFPSIPMDLWDRGEKAGTAVSQKKGESCCFWEKEESKLLLFLSPSVFHGSYQFSSLQTCSVQLQNSLLPIYLEILGEAYVLHTNGNRCMERIN